MSVLDLGETQFTRGAASGLQTAASGLGRFGRIHKTEAGSGLLYS